MYNLDGYPINEVLPIGVIDLTDVYNYFYNEMTLNRVSLMDLLYLGYQSIHDFFLINLETIFEEIIIKDMVDSYILFVEEITNLGLSTSFCDNLLGIIGIITNELLQQINYHDRTKFFIHVEEEEELHPRALISYVNV